MTKTIIHYKGRYGTYYMRQFARPPYTRYVWQWGYLITRADGSHHYAVMGESAERPLPWKVFHNLLTQ